MKIHNNKNLNANRRHLRNNSIPQEIILWSKLKAKTLGYKFRRQHSIGNYIVDFYCAEKRLIIEIDGYQHGEDVGLDKDEIRDNYLRNLNYTVLRFWNNEININLEGVILKILQILSTTPASGHPSSSEEGKVLL